MERASLDRGNHQGTLEAALAQYDDALAREPHSAQALFDRGMVLYQMRRFEAARRDLEACLRDMSGVADVHNLLGCILSQLGDQQAALASFEEAIRLEPRAAGAYYNRGAARQFLGDLPGAEADFSAAIALDPSLADAFNRRSIVRHNQGDFDGALDDADSAIALDPQPAEHHYNRGTANLSLGRMRDALADFDEALRRDPQHCLAHLARGNARYHLGDIGNIDDYRAAFDIDPQLAAGTLVRVLQNDLRRDRTAMYADCEKHLERNPNDTFARCRRALSNLLEGRAADARDDLERIAQELGDEWPRFDVILSAVRRQRGS